MPDAAHSAAVPADLVELGRIAAAYGVKGWVKVHPHSTQSEALRQVSSWWLTRPAPELARGVVASVPQAYKVLQARSQGATIVAQLAGVADRDQAEALRGYAVQVSRSEFPAADEDEYYWVDLIGCAFYTDADGEQARVGVVDGVLDNGAHAILRVVLQRAPAPGGEPEPRRDAKGRPLEMLVPFVRAHILAVDLAARRIDSNWPMEY
ncbi:MULTISPECIES: ribosome maturation factor RimM [Bordetella]|uniref:Ribosome maturation factor RimM n=1 Tax=Bordetella genomosp. 2 TaxID=1983456 RepID=A0A261W0A6_9BORD|nr:MULTISPECIES: ribosome maturation factor RimM [Bordetella]OZI79808.1 ribosome maturation factor RimM [Bordetella genomosp. 2]